MKGLILGCLFLFFSSVSIGQEINLKDLTGLYLANISYIEKQMKAKGFDFDSVDSDENTIYKVKVDTSIISEGFWSVLGLDVNEKIIISKGSKVIIYECVISNVFQIMSELLAAGYKKESFSTSCFGGYAYKFTGPKNYIYVTPMDKSTCQLKIN